MDKKVTPKSVDEYIASMPPHVQDILQKVRATIKEAVPHVVETISYQMPAYVQHTTLVYFAAYKNHIGFYPTSSGIEHFKGEFGNYKWSKGAVQFPIDKEIPYDLIRRITLFRMEDDRLRNEEKMARNKK